jgi:hypothetical protein
MQNNKCEGGQGKAATSIRFIIVPIEEEENNDYDIKDVYEDDDKNNSDDGDYDTDGIYDDGTHVVTGRCQPWQRPVTTWVYKPEAANAV